MILFLAFLALSIFSFILTLIFNRYKKKGYYLNHSKILIVLILIISFIFLILNTPFFISSDSKFFIDKKDEYILPTLIFNLSNAFYFFAIVLLLLSLFNNDEDAIELETPSKLNSKKGTISIGRIMKDQVKKSNFFLSLKDLEKHMFICGATGTGKSNFLQNFLINFKKIYKVPFFLVEFKGEYAYLQKKVDDLLILWPGENFSINIFNPGKMTPIIHAERIFDILKSGKFLDENAEFSPQMEKVLVEILTEVCKHKNSQNWSGFEAQCDKYLKENKKNIPMLSQTLISIKNRIRRFSQGPLRALFASDHRIDVLKLFKSDVLLDLSSIIKLGGEKEDALFFLNMILKYLWDKNLTEGAKNYNGIKHLTCIEDAQYFAPQDLMKKSKLTTYLEDIALLQRGTGECLITLATRPDISKEILANCGVIVSFQNHLEKDIICELLNLDVENKSFLSKLEEGQCIVRVNSVKKPFLLKIPYIKHNSIPVLEIVKKNQLILKQKGLDRCKVKRDEFDIHVSSNKRKIESIKVSNDNLMGDSFDGLKTYLDNLFNLQKKKE